MSCRWGKQITGLTAGLMLATGGVAATDLPLPMPVGEKIEAAVDARLDEAVSVLQQWVAIQSVTDATDSHRDDKTRLLELIAEKSRALGFRARLVANNQVAIIDLDDRVPAIGILVHADVVPVADSSLWSYPPFSGELAEEAVWGRGAADDKGPIAATLYALAAINDLGVKLAGGVRVIVGTSEENMIWDDFEAVAELGLAPAKGWTADAAFPVVHAEKSFINAVVSFSNVADASQTSISHWQGGTAPNSIPGRASLQLPGDLKQATAAADQYRVEHPEVRFEIKLADGPQSGMQLTQLELVALGKSGHGSRPESGVNAITHLARMVARAGLLSGGYDESAAGRSLQFLGEVIAGSTDGASLGIDRTDSVMGSTTVNVGQVVTDEQGVSSYLNIRGPIGLSAQQIEQSLVAAVAPMGGQVEMVAAMDPLWVEPDNPFVLSLMASFNRWSDAGGEPLSIGGTTYAKAFPGYVAFGMGFMDQRVPVHAPNERMPVAVLRKGMAIYVDAIISTVGVQ